MPVHDHSTCSGLVTRLRDLFGVFESMGVRVGMVWINPVHVPTLQADVHCYDSASAHLQQVDFNQARGGALVGYLFGAQVYSSGTVPIGHAAMIPDGFDAKLVDGAASFPLVLK